MPTFQTRAVEPKGDRLAARTDGSADFLLPLRRLPPAVRHGQQSLDRPARRDGRDARQGLLANRTDLTAEYVETVVRNGKGAMPPLSRVDVTPAELNAIAKYLGKGK